MCDLHMMKRLVIKKNKFKNMTDEIWKSTNEQSKKTRGISKLEHKDIFNVIYAIDNNKK